MQTRALEERETDRLFPNFEGLDGMLTMLHSAHHLSDDVRGGHDSGELEDEVRLKTGVITGVLSCCRCSRGLAGVVGCATVDNVIGGVEMVIGRVRRMSNKAGEIAGTGSGLH